MSVKELAARHMNTHTLPTIRGTIVCVLTVWAWLNLCPVSHYDPPLSSPPYYINCLCNQSMAMNAILAIKCAMSGGKPNILI